MDARDFNAFRSLHNVLQNYQILASEPNLLDNAPLDHATNSPFTNLESVSIFM